MVMAPEPIFAAVEAAEPPRPLLLLSASGRRFDHSVATELAAGDGFSLLCGRYEGVDQRVADHLCDGELSVGDFVLAGGEAAAAVVIDAVARLVPGVMGNEASGADESFADRPARVPAVHPAGRVPRARGARGAAQRRPRPGGAVAAGGRAAPHARPPARPARRDGPDPRRRGAPARIPGRRGAPGNIAGSSIPELSDERHRPRRPRPSCATTSPSSPPATP